MIFNTEKAYVHMVTHKLFLYITALCVALEQISATILRRKKKVVICYDNLPGPSEQEREVSENRIITRATTNIIH